LNLFGSMLTIFFTDRKVQNYEDAKTSDLKMFAKFFKALLKNGILIPPSQFEAWFLSVAHRDEVLNEALERIEKAVKEI